MLRQISGNKQKLLLAFIKQQNRAKRRRQSPPASVASAKRPKLTPAAAPDTKAFPFWMEVSAMLHVFGDVVHPKQETIQATHNASEYILRYTPPSPTRKRLRANKQRVLSNDSTRVAVRYGQTSALFTSQSCRYFCASWRGVGKAWISSCFNCQVSDTRPEHQGIQCAISFETMNTFAPCSLHSCCWLV